MKYGTLVRIPENCDLIKVSEEKFAKIKEMGLESCQLVYKPKEYNTEDAKIIKAAAEKYGVEISAQFCGYYDTYCAWDVKYDYRLAGINSPLFGGMRIDYLISAIPFLKEVGTTDMIIHAGFVPNDPFAQEYVNMLCGVKLLGRKLKANGLNLLFETGGESPVTLLRLIEECELDNLFINLDTANLIMYGYGNPVDAIYTFGKYVRNIHAKDGLPPKEPNQRGVETIIGEGYVDFEKVFKGLKALGYDRFITIENELKDASNEVILDAFDYLKEVWGRV